MISVLKNLSAHLGTEHDTKVPTQWKEEQGPSQMQGPMGSPIDIKMGGASCGGMDLGCKRERCLDKDKKSKGSGD